MANRAARSTSRREKVHGADDVVLVQRPAAHARRVDDEEGVQDRVDLGRLHDAGEDRVALVGSHIFRALERQLGRIGAVPGLCDRVDRLGAARGQIPLAVGRVEDRQRPEEVQVVGGDPATGRVRRDRLGHPAVEL